MIYGLIRKRSFEYGKFLGEKWLVIVDATQLFCFKERHCGHCLSKTVNRGTPEERTIYYHQVLEAKIVFGDDMVVSLYTCEPVFDICRKNKWDFLIRYKEVRNKKVLRW